MSNLAKFSMLIAVVVASSCTQQEQEKVTSVPFPGGVGTSIPYLFSGTEGLMLSWVKMIDDTTAQLNYSRLNAEEWEQPKAIVQGADWFINWADFPSITENNGNLLTHFLKKSSVEKFSYDVKLNILPKGAVTWNNELQLHTDSTQTEHGFVSVVPYGKDSFFVAWLDGRNSEAATEHEHAGHGGAMSIRAAVVGADGTVTKEALLDGKTCDCCQTTATITDNGPIVIYRDRSDSEVRDIAITRFVNEEWTAPKLVYQDGWEINGCPVNGPKVDANGNDVVVAWFTGVNNEPVVKIAFSTDGGENFDEPIQVSGLETLGRVDVEMLERNVAVVSWMETDNGITSMKAMKVESSGKKHVPLVVAEIDAVRKSGFPQMEQVDSRLYFSWTAITDGISEVKTAYVAISAL